MLYESCILYYMLCLVKLCHARVMVLRTVSSAVQGIWRCEGTLGRRSLIFAMVLSAVTNTSFSHFCIHIHTHKLFLGSFGNLCYMDLYILSSIQGIVRKNYI